MILGVICVLFALLFVGCAWYIYGRRYEDPHSRGCDCGECRERMLRRIGKDGW